MPCQPDIKDFLELIYDLRIVGKVPYYSFLKKILGWDTRKIDNVYFHLIDLGYIDDSEWEKVGNYWIRGIHILDEEEQIII